MTVASSVASGYVTLLSLDEQLRVTESTLKSREEAFNLAKRQFETGYSSRLELMQSDSELRSTRAQVPVLQHQIAQQENALSLLLGSNPGAVARSESFEALTPLTLPSQLPSTLLTVARISFRPNASWLRQTPRLPRRARACCRRST